MRMITRSIPVAALALCLGSAAALRPGAGQRQLPVVRRRPGRRDGLRYAGPGRLPPSRRSAVRRSSSPSGPACCSRSRKAWARDEVSSYIDASGTQAVTFNDIRKYSAVLMAFPIKAAVQPYLGVGYGIMHAVNPQATGLTGLQTRSRTSWAAPASAPSWAASRSRSVGSWPSASTRSPPRRRSTRSRMATATWSRSGRLLEGPTHTFTGGLRFGLGSAREGVKTGGY